jgi:hypothetical protein
LLLALGCRDAENHDRQDEEEFHRALPRQYRKIPLPPVRIDNARPAKKQNEI